MYILYSIAMGGWIGASHPYVSDWQQAQRFTYSAAVLMCRKHIQHNGQFGVVPVEVDALIEVGDV